MTAGYTGKILRIAGTSKRVGRLERSSKELSLKKVADTLESKGKLGA